MRSCDLRPGVRDFGCSGKRKRSGHGPTSASSQLERETGLEPATLCLGIRCTANAARAHRTPGAGDGTRTRDVLLGRNGVSDSSAADEPRVTSDLPPLSRPACRPGSTSHEPAPLSRNYTLLSSVAPSPVCCDPAGTGRPAPEHRSQSPR